MPATWPIATWMPTPVRNPISTLRERKSARNPSRMMRASEQEGAGHDRDDAGERDVLAADAIGAMPAMPAAMIAADGGVGADDEWRDEPNSAKTTIGIRIVYSPVITGMPAIFV